MEDTSSSKTTQKLIISILVLAVVCYLIIGIYYPISSIISKVFFDGTFGIDLIKEVFNSKRILKSLTNTISISIITVILVNILALFQLAITEIFEIKFSKLFKLIFLVPMVFNGILLVTGYDFIYSSNGIVTVFLSNIFPNINTDWFNGFIAVLIVQVFSMTIYHMFFVKDSIKLIDFSLIETARALNISKIRIIFKVIFPMILPSILSSSIFVFVASLASNSAPTFLGGKDFYMLSQSIKSFNSINYQNIASMLTILLGTCSILPLIFIKKIESKKRFYLTSHVNKQIKKIKINSKIIKTIIYVLAIIISIIYLLPIIVCIIYSFADINSIYMKTFPQSFSLSNYIRVFNNTDILMPIINSIRLSLGGTIIALIISLIMIFLTINYRSRIINILEKTLLIVWFLPAIFFATGFILAYNSSKIFSMNSDFILMLGYSLLVVNMIIYSIKAIIKNINNNILETARVLGCDKLNTFIKVLLPLLFQVIISTISLSILTLLSEFTISELLYSYSNKPISIVYRSEFTNSTPYQAANVLVYTVIILLLSIIVLSLIAFAKKINTNNSTKKEI